MIKIERLGSFDDIGKHAWDVLLGACDKTYVFQTYEFQSTWWKHFGGKHNRRELLLLSAQEDGRMIGIAPLMAVETPLLKKPSIRFVGTPICDYMDFIIAKGMETSVLQAFYGYLRSLACLEIDLFFLPETSPVVKLGGVSASAVDICPYIDLSGDWASTYKGLNSTVKKYVARRERSIAKAGKPVLDSVKEKSGIRSYFDEYFRIHIMRWRDYGGRYSQFQYASWRDFAIDVSEGLFQKGAIDLSYFKLDSDTIACHFGFKYNGVFHWYMPVYNPAYSKYSPGNLFIMEILKRSSLDGLTEFDFLRGNEPYKIFWTDKARRLFDCVSYPDNRILRGTGRSLRSARNIYTSHIKGRLKKLSPVMQIWYKLKGDKTKS